jgi:hypothetical protein
VPDQVCAGCHARERDGFQSGKHGMRVAVGLPPMQPRLARAPMRADAPPGPIGCVSCHGAHRFDRVDAAVEGCVRCHDDPHTAAYRGSPHHLAWEREQAGTAPPGTGVSCATCHLPRVVQRRAGRDVVRVEHGQQETLRPPARMVRDVCARCHGLPFSLTALADRGLVGRNVRGRPQPALTGVDLVTEEGRR